MNVLLVSSMSGSIRRDTHANQENVDGMMLDLGTTHAQAALLTYQQATLTNTQRFLTNVAGHLRKVLYQHSGKGSILGLHERKQKIMIQLTLPHMNCQKNHLRDKLIKNKRNHILRHLPMMVNLLNLNQVKQEDLGNMRRRNFAQRMLQVIHDRMIGHVSTFRSHLEI